MANKVIQRFYLKDDTHDIRIAFDMEGYVVEAKGFGMLMWTNDLHIDKTLIGKHIDELSEMLKKNQSASYVYTNFESGVHQPLLKFMRKYHIKMGIKNIFAKRPS